MSSPVHSNTSNNMNNATSFTPNNQNTNNNVFSIVTSNSRNNFRINEKIPTINQSKHIKCFWTISDETQWKPEARANHTLCLLNGTAYLIGGLGSKVHNQIIALSLGRLKWIPIL